VVASRPSLREDQPSRRLMRHSGVGGAIRAITYGALAAKKNFAVISLGYRPATIAAFKLFKCKHGAGSGAGVCFRRRENTTQTRNSRRRGWFRRLRTPALARSRRCESCSCSYCPRCRAAKSAAIGTSGRTHRAFRASGYKGKAWRGAVAAA
jgi:hypothetical protein